APAAFVAMFPHLHRFLMHKWYFDELYDVIFVRPAMWLGRLFGKAGDEQIIDRFGPHGAAYAVGVGNRITARLQSGYVYSYALVMLLGLIGAAPWVFWWIQWPRCRSFQSWSSCRSLPASSRCFSPPMARAGTR